MISEKSPTGLKFSLENESKNRVIYKYDNGGLLESENKTPTKEENDNIEALKTFAEKGDKVILLKTSNVQNTRTADSTINGVLWEVKTNRTPTESAIDSALRSSNGQSKNLIINIKSGISDAKLLAGLKGRIQRTNIQKIIVERNGVIVKTITRKELVNKKKQTK